MLQPVARNRSKVAFERAVNRLLRRVTLPKEAFPGTPVDIVNGNVVQSLRQASAEHRDDLVLPLKPSLHTQVPACRFSFEAFISTYESQRTLGN